MCIYIYNMGEGNGNLLQYSCLENPVDSGAGRAAVHRVPLTRDATRMTADAVIFFTLFFGRLARGPSEPNFNYTTSHAICQ